MEPLADGKGPIIWLKSTQDGRTLYYFDNSSHRGTPPTNDLSTPIDARPSRGLYKKRLPFIASWSQEPMQVILAHPNRALSIFAIDTRLADSALAKFFAQW